MRPTAKKIIVAVALYILGLAGTYILKLPHDNIIMQSAHTILLDGLDDEIANQEKDAKSE